VFDFIYYYGLEDVTISFFAITYFKNEDGSKDRAAPVVTGVTPISD
jgi:hypothetical protein